MQFDRVKALLADSQSQGHRLHVIGTLPKGEGYFHPLVLVDNPPDHAHVVIEEAFGSILSVQSFAIAYEVVHSANSTAYGLGASVWSKDFDRARAAAARLKLGTVRINAIRDSTLNASTAGHKQSGLGVEKWGAGLLEYTNAKTISLRSNSIIGYQL